jgi:hypothetical protein
MTEPVDAIIAIHNAFRQDMTRIDAAALKHARGEAGQESELQRFHLFNEILVWHAKGEELAVFPAVESVAPSVAMPYIMDHHGLDEAGDSLSEAMSAKDALQTARAAAALKFHHDIHLKKEDTHLYRIFRERIPIPEQSKTLGLMASTVPQERFPEVVTWMLPLVGADDRENMIRIWQMVLPPEAFAGLKPLIQKASGDGWAELTRRIPGLG